MGDPNVSGYQFLGRIERALDRPVRVVPGVSSVQVAASRARTPLEDSTVVTLHERGDLSDRLDRLVADVGERHLLVLPRPYDWMPERVAARLLGSGADPGLAVLVCERLTHGEESLARTTLGELAGEPEESRFSDLSVLVVRRDR
jgi:cobalt-precorrin-7 (C5)-methyltransferase